MEARESPGKLAECLLAAMGRPDPEDESDMVRAYTGAIILGEAASDLRIIRIFLQSLAK